jgi:hypothetical protein
VAQSISNGVMCVANMDIDTTRTPVDSTLSIAERQSHRPPGARTFLSATEAPTFPSQATCRAAESQQIPEGWPSGTCCIQESPHAAHQKMCRGTVLPCAHHDPRFSATYSLSTTCSMSDRQTVPIHFHALVQFWSSFHAPSALCLSIFTFRSDFGQFWTDCGSLPNRHSTPPAPSTTNPVPLPHSTGAETDRPRRTQSGPRGPDRALPAPAPGPAQGANPRFQDPKKCFLVIRGNQR